MQNRKFHNITRAKMLIKQKFTEKNGKKTHARGTQNSKLTFPPICWVWQCRFRPKSAFSRDLSCSRLYATPCQALPRSLLLRHKQGHKDTLNQSEFIYQFSRFYGPKGVMWGIKRKPVSLQITCTCFCRHWWSISAAAWSGTFNMQFGHRRVKEHIYWIKIYAKSGAKPFHVGCIEGLKCVILCKGG